MKYTNMVGKIKGFFIGLFVFGIVAIFVGIIVALAFCDFYVGHPFLTFMWMFMIPAIGYCVNWILGYICGDQYYNTGIVIDGNSLFDVVKTPKYHKRRMLFYFFECFFLLLVIVRFILFFPPFGKMIFGLFNPGHIDDYSPSFGIGVPIVGIISAIVELIVCFIIGMSSYEQSDFKYKKEIKITTSQVKKKNIEKKKPVYKFKFDEYPELLKKYETFKVWYFKKYETYETEEEKNNALNELNQSFESIAEAVFNTFNEVKPMLILKKTGEQFKWEDIINKPYDELTPTQKLILVRLLDKMYKYVLPKEYYNY